MKKYLYGALFLAAVGITVLACKKEVMNSPASSATLNTQTAKEKGDLFSANEKSTGNGALDSMAQAANLAQIEFHGSNGFFIETYNDTILYKVNVQEFQLDSVVRLTINDGSVNHNVLIDVKNEKIGIAYVGNFPFSNFFGSNGVTAHGNVLKNIVAVFTPYYALYGNVSNTWKDNGNGDVFDPTSYRKFWGKEYKSESPCYAGVKNVTYTDYAFWIKVGEHTEIGVPC